MQNYHLNPVGGRWKISFDHSDVFFAGFDTRQEAFEFCSEMTRDKPVCLTVHRADGTVFEQRKFTPSRTSVQHAA